MHYVAILYERTLRTRASAEPTIELRGYKPKTYVPPEFSGVELPVYALTYDVCPTFRDTYLQWVAHKESPPTFERYQGKVIDRLYKLIHKTCEEYVTGSQTREFDLYGFLMARQDEILAEAKEDHESVLRQIEIQPSDSMVTKFDEGLRKMVRFEAEITSAFMDFEIARLQSCNPRRLFSEYFDFNTDVQLSARSQGFRAPATPDFIYRHEVIGDIKSGKWQRFFEYTIVAYTLAYEAHTCRDMDYGAILHVELPTSRLVPAHYKADIEFLDDHKRRRFLVMRNRKLEIIFRGLDPGKPNTKAECDSGCPFIPDCWDDEEQEE